MNALGLSMLFKSGGCICGRETINVNGIRYTVKESLGNGGFSTVDLIENKSSRKKYALKRIQCHSVDDEKIANEEINYLKKFRHPNIIELIDATIKGSADIIVNSISEAFLIFPYYHRGTLHDYLSVRALKADYLNVEQVLRVFQGVCAAVKYLHDYQPDAIAHRDLKVANVCLSGDQLMPILMDLGSCAHAKVQVCGAQDAQKLQDLAAERCSITYRPPELFHVESYCVIDQRTDIWSLGCILYALCYFKSPFDVVHERGDSVNLAVLSGTVYIPEADQTPFNEDIHDLIHFMVNVNPSERPFIDSVIERTNELQTKLEHVV